MILFLSLSLYGRTLKTWSVCVHFLSHELLGSLLPTRNHYRHKNVAVLVQRPVTVQYVQYVPHKQRCYRPKSKALLVFEQKVIRQQKQSRHCKSVFTMDSTGSTNNRARNATRRKRRKPMQDQRFSNYLTFGFEFTVCLGVFALTYAVVLVALWPLLSAKGPEHVPKRRPIDFLKKPHIPPSLKDIHLPGKEKISDMALSMKKKLQKINTEEELFEQAKLEFEILKKEKESKRKKLLRKAGDKKTLPEGQRSGFMVLGMHRSGTSMLSGLLHTSCGYTVGGPLIGSAADNEKGFFERIDIVLQNDEFMWKQGVWWATNVINYDWKKALTGLEDGTVDFKVHGESGLAFLNNPDNAPWLQKDPRMCITLKTWLKLMNNEPAIVFTVSFNARRLLFF